MGPLIPLFRTSGDVCPGFQSQGGLACMLSCLRAIPQIHLWCDTCRPLDGKHGSRATLTHVLAAVRRIHKHWWRRGRSRGSNLWPGPGLEPATLPCRSTAHLTTRPFRLGIFLSFLLKMTKFHDFSRCMVIFLGFPGHVGTLCGNQTGVLYPFPINERAKTLVLYRYCCSLCWSTGPSSRCAPCGVSAASGVSLTTSVIGQIDHEVYWDQTVCKK